MLGLEPWKDEEEEKREREQEEEPEEEEDRAAICPICKERELRLAQKTNRPTLRQLMEGLERHWSHSRAWREYRRRRYKRLQARHDMLKRYMEEAREDANRGTDPGGTSASEISEITGFT